MCENFIVWQIQAVRTMDPWKVNYLSLSDGIQGEIPCFNSGTTGKEPNSSKRGVRVAHDDVHWCGCGRISSSSAASSFASVPVSTVIGVGLHILAWVFFATMIVSFNNTHWTSELMTSKLLCCLFQFFFVSDGVTQLASFNWTNPPDLCEFCWIEYQCQKHRILKEL